MESIDDLGGVSDQNCVVAAGVDKRRDITENTRPLLSCHDPSLLEGGLDQTGDVLST